MMMPQSSCGGLPCLILAIMLCLGQAHASSRAFSDEDYFDLQDGRYVSDGGWVQLDYQLNCSGPVMVYPTFDLDCNETTGVDFCPAAVFYTDPGLNCSGSTCAMVWQIPGLLSAEMFRLVVQQPGMQDSGSSGGDDPVQCHISMAGFVFVVDPRPRRRRTKDIVWLAVAAFSAATLLVLFLVFCCRHDRNTDCDKQQVSRFSDDSWQAATRLYPPYYTFQPGGNPPPGVELGDVFGGATTLVREGSLKRGELGLPAKAALAPPALAAPRAAKGKKKKQQGGATAAGEGGPEGEEEGEDAALLSGGTARVGGGGAWKGRLHDVELVLRNETVLEGSESPRASSVHEREWGDEGPERSMLSGFTPSVAASTDGGMSSGGGGGGGGKKPKKVPKAERQALALAAAAARSSGGAVKATAVYTSSSRAVSPAPTRPAAAAAPAVSPQRESAFAAASRVPDSVAITIPAGEGQPQQQQPHLPPPPVPPQRPREEVPPADFVIDLF